ncbi:hypothetical protein WA026_003520 [Henosepilachna vigintioctopunctata]|uniref:ABC transporter domain-containing protein n=1 Tax=Henosepilachna vigintioctopunctata TaxID=420089 RepID=A0AAW1TMC1_9CUCU
MRQWSECENKMVSTERMIEFISDIDIEPQRDSDSSLPKDWPSFGRLEFKNVNLKYKDTDPLILKNISFSVASGEKIGIVGRTGAGKSSILTSLFQLYPFDGSIIIDGMDTTKMPLSVVRSNISIIPQEPMLFSGTMRKNLDPFGDYDKDEIIWDALEQVELKATVQKLSSGLDTPVTSSGSNFSVGEKQLICLARALIRRNKILVLDEATANVDPYTDSLIQKTIRNKFSKCTILTIAHRLNTVMDSDKILVMKNGEVSEFDDPYSLLNNGGLLRDLILSTGETMSKKLELVAEENFNRKNISEKKKTSEAVEKQVIEHTEWTLL